MVGKMRLLMLFGCVVAATACGSILAADVEDPPPPEDGGGSPSADAAGAAAEAGVDGTTDGAATCVGGRTPAGFVCGETTCAGGDQCCIVGQVQVGTCAPKGASCDGIRIGCLSPRECLGGDRCCTSASDKGAGCRGAGCGTGAELCERDDDCPTGQACLEPTETIAFWHCRACPQ